MNKNARHHHGHPTNRQIHAGFNGDYKSTAPAMKEAVGYVLSKFPTAPLWITGKLCR